MAPHRLALIALLVISGCASLQGYGPPTEPFSQSYGCDYDDIMAYRASRDGPARPRVGWTACDVLARYGSPRDAQVAESVHGFSAHWWFPDPLTGMMDPKLLALEQNEGSEWVVTYVSW